VNAIDGRTLTEIFRSPDDLKFRSCMTLFAAAGGPERARFDAALRKYCGGMSDERTLALLTASLT
jgi:uncharacterized protein (DUF1810 family)